MPAHRPPRLLPSDITPEADYLAWRMNRRQWLSGAASSALTAVAGLGAASSLLINERASAATPTPLQFAPNARYRVSDAPTSYRDITTYNNFYEFGTDKADPGMHSGAFKPTPWQVTVGGECEVKGSFSLEDILKPHPLEERIYRLRCVERWSMVIPWVGFPLKDLLARFKPNSNAKYVAFKTIMRPEEMPGQRSDVLEWPYVEGLRMDEAMNPLTLMAVGLYGRTLPNQNGAPLRLVVPWKYGFKSIKSIVEIRFVEKQPPTSWNLYSPREYGFYSNVNPDRAHPRWSQARERRIGAKVSLFDSDQPTLMFNGYGDEVASLYRNMDLQKFF